MMAQLPFQDTVVSMYDSQGKIKAMLYEIGFTAIHEISNGPGESRLIAEIANGDKSATFEFGVHVDKILEQLPNSRKYEKLFGGRREQAMRIAWRVVFYQVKALGDSIKLGIMTIPEAFGGTLLLKDKDGKGMRLADWIADGIEKGKLSAHSISSQFLIEDRR